MNTQQRDKAIGLIDDYLTVLACVDRDLSRFSGAYVITTDISDAIPDADPVCYMGAKPSDLNRQWKVTLLGRPMQDGDAVSLFQSNTVHWSEVSGLAKKFRGFTTADFESFAKYEWARVTRDAKVPELESVWLAEKQDKFRIFDPGEQVLPEGLLSHRRSPEILHVAQLLLGFAFMQPCFWVAKVSIEERAPSISLITDPTGVKELWKFREIPEGKRRRDALLHWVSCHWRQNRNDPDVENYVRRSLRGARQLRCDGLSVEVSESAEDRASFIEAVKERAIMKAKRSDWRKRKRPNGR